MILGGWGVVYVWQCLLALSSGGVPIVYEHHSPGGLLVMRAESYHFDLPSNVLRLDSISIVESDGTKIASARSILLTDVIPGRRPVHANARDVFARIVRKKDGKLRLLDYLPPSTEEESRIGYTADLRHVSVLYEDQTTTKVWRRWVSADVARLDGVGSELRVNASPRIQNAGTVVVSARSSLAGGLSVKFSTAKLEVAELVRRFADSPDSRDVPEVREIRLASGRLAGDGFLILRPESQPVWAANVVATVERFAYGNEASADHTSLFGTLGPEGAALRVTASGPGSKTEFEGNLRWKNEVLLAGSLVASVRDARSLPAFLRRSVPGGTTFSNGTLSGWLAYGEASGVRLAGITTATQARWERETVRDLAANLDVDGEKVIVQNARGTWQGSRVEGALVYALKDGALQGHFRAPNADLKQALSNFGLTTIAGKADIQALLDGKASDPVVVVRAEGHGQSLLQERPIDLGRFELGGALRGDRFNLNRFTILGPAGAATASGAWDVRRNSVDVDVLATGVPLQAFLDEVSGSAAFSGKVVGPTDRPRAVGQVEVFNALAANQQIPFARGDVEIDRDGLRATRVLAFKKGAQATGEGAVAFKDMGLSGVFTVFGIDLSGYPPAEISGMARITRGVLSGTLQDPILEADVEAENVAARGIALDNVDLHAVVRNGVIRMDRLRGAAGTGTITGSGSLDIASQSGSFDLSGEALPLGLLLARALEDVSVEGLLGGTLKGEFANGKFSTVAFDGELQNFKVNEAFLGGGPITASHEGSIWSGTLFLGTIDAYLQVPALTFDPDTGKISGTLVSDNFQASVLYNSLKRYLDDEQGQSRVPEDLRRHLESLDGRLDLDAAISGDTGTPNVDVQALKLDSMTVGGQPAGQIVARGSKQGRIWNFEQFEWTGGPGTVRLNRGRLDEHGDIDLDGEVRNLKWKKLAQFFPQLERVEGTSDLPFLVTGKSKSPEIQASFSYEEGAALQRITPWPGATVSVRNPRQTTRRIDLENVLVKDGSIDAQGVFNLEGFTGTIEGKLPFRYPFEIPESEAWSAVARMPDRPLSSLSEFLPGMDIKNTDGTVSARLTLGGTRGAPLVTGSIDGAAKSLAFNDLMTRLNDLVFQAKFENEKVSVSASGKGSQGGSFETEDVGVSLDNLDEALKKSFQVLMMNRLYGTFRMNEFRLDYVDKQAGPMTATVSGALGLAGTLERPEIGGQLLLSNANLTTPPAYEAAVERTKLLVDPRFNISMVTANNMLLRVPTGRFELSGGGLLQGSLSSPQFTSTLEVEAGNVRLPNARIVIEPGGTVAITYRSSPTGTTVARVEVDMQGRTQVSAESFTGIVERYDITLNIRGDLLTDNGLQLSAQADPPDLSQERILAILGQRDVLVGNAGEGFRADRQLQSALLGLALPYFAGSFTEDLARQLGLDYLNIEYNTYDQFAVTAAISLGRDLVLSARRQLSSPLPGERPKFDLRLSYRPPFRNKALRRFTFSVGMDQDRPWKIAVEYGIRF